VVTEDPGPSQLRFVQLGELAVAARRVHETLITGTSVAYSGKNEVKVTARKPSTRVPLLGFLRSTLVAVITVEFPRVLGMNPGLGNRVFDGRQENQLYEEVMRSESQSESTRVYSG